MRNISIKKKLFLAMLLISFVPIVLLAIFSVYISQNSMRKQLIQNRELGMDWMGDKLTTELKNYSNVFYEIEVDKNIKKNLLSVALGGEWDDAILRDVRTDFEEALNLYPQIVSIELYDYQTEEGYVATRESFQSKKCENLQETWRSRKAGLQTNNVLQRDGTDFLMMHQVREFSTNKILSVIFVRLNQYAFTEQIEENMETGESAILYNDEGKILKKIGEAEKELDEELIEKILGGEQEFDRGNCYSHNRFYFYETISKGKLNLIYMVPDQLVQEQLKVTFLIAFLIMLSSIMAVLGLSILFSEIISKPIVVLSKRMQTTDIHNFSAEKPIRRNDEIGLLQKSFDKMMLKNQELVKREYESELEKKKAQLRALQAQINPHFLYNSLQIIAGMAVTGKSKEIYPVVTALSDILRYAMSFSEEKVSLEKEIQYLKSYVFIQNSRFQNRLKLIINISEKAKNACIPKLILQPLVENCLEHGLATKYGEWHIEICAYLKERDLIVEIIDNGVGIEKEKLEEIKRKLQIETRQNMNSSSHIGLENVNSRIRLQSGDEYGLQIESDEKSGTKIKINLKAEGESL